MDKFLADGIRKLDDEDVSMMDIYHGYINELMCEFPELTMPQARIIVRNAFNRADVGRTVRAQIEWFMAHGEFWKE